MKVKYAGLSNKLRIKINEILEKEKDILLLDNIDYKIYICGENYKKYYHEKYSNSKWQDKNAYRAITITKHKRIFVYVNRGETEYSVLWLLLHELTHANLRKNKYLKNILNLSLQNTLDKYKISTPDEYMLKLRDEEFHEDLYEEQICDWVATTIVGFNYNKYWWIKQLKEIEDIINKNLCK